MLIASGGSISDTLGDMAGFVPYYVAAEKLAIRTKCHRNHSRNQGKGFSLIPPLLIDWRQPPLAAVSFQVASAKAWSDG